MGFRREASLSGCRPRPPLHKRTVCVSKTYVRSRNKVELSVCLEDSDQRIDGIQGLHTDVAREGAKRLSTLMEQALAFGWRGSLGYSGGSRPLLVGPESVTQHGR